MESQETKIRRGQASNLAINDAISLGKQQDVKYIYQQYIYYHSLLDIIQGSDLEMIASVLNKPNFDAAIKALQNAFSEK
jgi:hypothetical protein